MPPRSITYNKGTTTAPTTPLPCDLKADLTAAPMVSTSVETSSSRWLLQELPNELQVRILSYLRAHELSQVHQVNRHMANSKQLHHDIVVYCAEQVYPPKWTQGFQYQPTTATPTLVDPAAAAAKSSSSQPKKGKPRSGSFGSLEDTENVRAAKHRSGSLGSIEDGTQCMITPQKAEVAPVLYTFEHLRNMELLVVARVLSSPEPSTGYVVSKSWCKTALCWLEGQQERRNEQQQQASMEQSNKKKKVKKMMKAKSLKKSTRAATPPPNINSDITCAHNQLQHYTSTKSARARRRLLDKQAWKILKVLYPESTPLPAQSGECIQCIAESCQLQKMEHDQQEALKEQRKLPLQNPQIRRFYTRTRGVPECCLRYRHSSLDTSVKKQSDDTCPLIDGTYYVLPRSWCHGWRRYIKTGEGGGTTYSSTSVAYAPPDASALLCDAHRLALLPPHLEAYLYGESHHLFDSSFSGGLPRSPQASVPEQETLPPGQGPTQESILAMRSLGLNENEIGMQLSALRRIEARNDRYQREQRLQEEANTSASRNELLDQENYHVVEILSETEFRALIGCWAAATSVYVLRFTVQAGVVTSISATTERDSNGGPEDAASDFGVSVCRSCDATGRYQCVKGKQRCSRSGNKKNDKSRSATSLEY
jgi:hypothetical protein